MHGSGILVFIFLVVTVTFGELNCRARPIWHGLYIYTRLQLVMGFVARAECIGFKHGVMHPSVLHVHGKLNSTYK